MPYRSSRCMWLGMLYCVTNNAYYNYLFSSIRSSGSNPRIPSRLSQIDNNCFIRLRKCVRQNAYWNKLLSLILLLIKKYKMDDDLNILNECFSQENSTKHIGLIKFSYIIKARNYWCFLTTGTRWYKILHRDCTHLILFSIYI